MSYEYYLQACENQGPQEVPTQTVIEIFEPYIVRRDPTCLDLEFDELNNCSIFMNSDAPTTSGMMISRPCGTEALVRCMYEVMRLGYFVFYEPDGHGMIALTSETQMHLIEGMVESLGVPVVASSWEDFYHLWENNRH
jgi:hypothetical protein